MTILGLYHSPDSVMEAVQKYPHSRSAACSPDGLLQLPTWTACIFVSIAQAPKAETVE